ncbi:MAG: hypothetical protein EHM93_07960 [Bacteroidales bacterium]|nr:MAG: hypothetical protein EHM93_07960 [Bacteroidales bacterium]
MVTTNSNPNGSKADTNIPLDDKGHRKLIEIHSHIKNLLNSGGNKNDLTEIFFALSYFYENYLIKEEILLKRMGYPNLECHSESHKTFIRKIEKLKDSINKDAMRVLKELDIFILDWVKDHEATYNA